MKLVPTIQPSQPKQPLRRSWLKTFLAAALAAAVLTLAAIPAPAPAATPNLSIAIPGVQMIAFHISGQYTATTAAVVRFNLPFAATLIGAQASARASGGTSPTLTVDVKAGGSTVLSAPITVTAGAVAEGTITTATLADEAAITVDLTIGGTSPTWNDITVVLTIVRN